MVQAASSSAHGGIIKEAGGGYDMAEFDQALFLYLNGQDQTSAIIQDQPQTLNIFPSQPMHVVEPAPPKGSMLGTNNTTPNAGAGPSSKRAPPSSNNAVPPAGGSKKDGKPAAVKREAGSSGGAMGSGTPSTSNQQEGPRTPDAKTLRRLAQNREAARKSRLRKKAYIQNLETSRIRLSQLEQELHRSRTQGAVFGGGVLSGGNGGLSPGMQSNPS
jgi:transcription factor TGA